MGRCLALQKRGAIVQEAMRMSMSLKLGEAGNNDLQMRADQPSVLIAQVALPMPVSVPVPGSGVMVPPIGLGSGADQGDVVQQLSTQNRLFELVNADPKALYKKIEAALVDANKAGNTSKAGDFTIDVKAHPFAQPEPKTISIQRDGTMRLIEPYSGKTLAGLGNVRSYVDAQAGVSIGFKNLVNLVAPDFNKAPADAGARDAVIGTALVFAKTPAGKQVLENLSTAFNTARGQLIAANTPKQNTQPSVALSTSIPTAARPPQIPQATLPTQAQIKTTTVEGQVAVRKQNEPALEGMQRATKTVFAELTQLNSKLTDPTQLSQLNSRAQKIEANFNQLLERTERFATLSGAYKALTQYPGLNGFSDRDGTALTRSVLEQRLPIVNREMHGLYKELNKQLTELTTAVRWQQTQYAAQNYDRTAKQMVTALGDMSHKIEVGKLYFSQTPNAAAQAEIKKLEASVKSYQQAATQYLGVDYGRDLINAGYTGNIRDESGKQLNRATLNQEAQQAFKTMQQAVQGFDTTIRRLNDLANTPSENTSPASNVLKVQTGPEGGDYRLSPGEFDPKLKVPTHTGHTTPQNPADDGSNNGGSVFRGPIVDQNLSNPTTGKTDPKPDLEHSIVGGGFSADFKPPPNVLNIDSGPTPKKDSLSELFHDATSLRDIGAIVEKLPKESLNALDEKFIVDRIRDFQDDIRGPGKWDSELLAEKTYQLLTQTAIFQIDKGDTYALEQLTRRPDIVEYMLANGRRFQDPQSVQRAFDGLKVPMKTRRTDTHGAERPQALFGSSVVPRDFSDENRLIVDAYLNRLPVVNNDDGKAYILGNSVRNLRLIGKPSEQLNQELIDAGFKRNDTFTKDFKTQELTSNRQWIYTHPDGGMVRIKPDGEPGSLMRPQPHASKSLNWPITSNGSNFDEELFKVDEAGNPRPKWPADLNTPSSAKTPGDRFGYLDYMMDNIHVDLPLNTARDGKR
jgi:hypothetical protein